jgi:hypothetical protein
MNYINESNESINSNEFNESINSNELNESINSNELNESINSNEFNESINSNEFNESNESNELNKTNKTNKMEKIICNKSDIILTKNKDNSYNLNFNIDNNNINILLQYKSVDLLNIYLDFLKNSNSGIIERIIILNKKNNKITYCIIFKQFGADFGIKQKFLCVKTESNILTNCIKINSSSIKYNLNEFTELKNCEEIYSKYGNLQISKNLYDKINVTYNFDIDFNEDLPIYMENLVGLFMKKLFINFKSFLENFKL